MSSDLEAAGRALPLARTSNGRFALGRLPVLDGLRGLASLQVLVYHYLVVAWLYETPHPPGVTDEILRRLGDVVLSGVDLFFVLSGFLITRVVLAARGAPGFFRTFYLRRVCRIAPVYALLLAVAVACSALDVVPHLFQGPISLAWYVVFAQNVPMALLGTFGAVGLSVTWSLAVEEQFYVLFPFAARIGRQGLLWLSVMAIVLACVARQVIYATHLLPSQAAYVLLPTRADALACGVLLAVVGVGRHRRPTDLPTAGAHRWVGPVAVGVGVAAITLAWSPADALVRFAFVERTLIAAFYALAITWLLEHPDGWIGRVLTSKLPSQMGQWSYSTYLLHLPVLHLLFGALRHQSPRVSDGGDLALIAVAFVLTTVAAAASWRFIEAPAIAVGHRASWSAA